MAKKKKKAVKSKQKSKRKIPLKDWAKVKAEYVNGASQRDLCEKYHIGPHAMSQRVYRHGWEAERQQLANARIENLHRIVVENEAADLLEIKSVERKHGKNFLNAVFQRIFEPGENGQPRYKSMSLADYQRASRALLNIQAFLYRSFGEIDRAEVPPAIQKEMSQEVNLVLEKLDNEEIYKLVDKFIGNPANLGGHEEASGQE